jgi:hypothetical protein
MTQIRIAALGSSFAAGPNIDPIADKAARRSGNNYAHQLASKLNADLADLTVSGATLHNVLDEPQLTSAWSTVPPQLEGLPPDADIVTLTVGGNDVGYPLGMIVDLLLSYFAVPLRWASNRFLGHPSTGISLEQLIQRLLDVDAIHGKAPQARIYLVQYLSVFGEQSRPGPVLPLTSEQLGHYWKQGVLLDRTYEAAVEARSEFVVLVPVA